MRRLSLSRRTLLRGLGGVGVGLPLLEAMSGRAQAQSTAGPKRLLVFFTPGGTVRTGWLPVGTETDFALGPILAPLAPIQDKLLVVDGLGLHVTSTGFGHPHSRGMGGVLTGQPLARGLYETCAGTAGFAEGPSIDQVVAQHLKADRKFASLEVAVNWPTDRRDGGKAAPTNCITYAGANQPVPMMVDPKLVWDRLFLDLVAEPLARGRAAKREVRILDAVLTEYRGLIPRLGQSDRLKLDEHLTRLEELERRALATPTVPDGIPAAPEPLADPSSGQVGGAGDVFQYNSIRDAEMPVVGKTMMDLVAAAFACDLTAVATLQWSDSQSRNTFPWLDLNENHHAYQHSSGYQPDALTRIHRWYSEQFLYMIQALEAAGVLDETLILWVSEIQHPKTHLRNNMPFVLAGGGSAVRTGRFVTYPDLPHNNLLTSVANLYGLELASFGRPAFCTGPLAGLV